MRLAGGPCKPICLKIEESGAIRHAIRFTAFNTAEGYIWPARHPVPDLTGTDRSLDLPPMGARFRLKSSYAIPESASAEVRVILQAMKEYGIVLADHGSEWRKARCARLSTNLALRPDPASSWDYAGASKLAGDGPPRD